MKAILLSTLSLGVLVLAGVPWWAIVAVAVIMSVSISRGVMLTD